ncbi:hypothetical protein NUM3379_09770 [Kineococcus sp. NUM-3379]
MRERPDGAGRGYCHDHGFGPGPGTHGFGPGFDDPGHAAAWPLLAVLLGLALLAVVLASVVAHRRGVDVRAWLAGILRRVREAVAGPRPTAPAAAAVLPVHPRVDLGALGSHPPVVRERFARLAALVEELQTHLDTGGRPADALHQHRLTALRQGLQELADTLGGLPPDVAQAPARHGGPSPLEAAAGTVALLEAEALALRGDVHALTVSRLQQQHRFAVAKYGRTGSALDL